MIIKTYEEFIQMITEAAEGVKLNVSKNYKNFLKYLKQLDKRYQQCITGDEYALSRLEKDFYPFYVDAKSPIAPVFYIKGEQGNDFTVCINESFINSNTTDYLKNYYKLEIGSSRNNNGEKLNNKKDFSPFRWYFDADVDIDAGIEETGKFTRTKKVLDGEEEKIIKNISCKDWPKSKEGNTVYDLGDGNSQDFRAGYILYQKSEFNDFAYNLGNMYLNTYGEGVLSNIFLTNGKAKSIRETIEYLNNIYKNGSKIEKFTIDAALANGISEQLAVYYTMENAYGILDTIKSEFEPDYGALDLVDVIIPVQQNYPIADYLLKFDKLNFLVNVSVKSGKSGGNSSTFLSFVPTNVNSYSAPSSKEINEFFGKYVEDIKNADGDMSKVHPDSSMAQYAYDSLLYACNQKKYNGQKVLYAFEMFTQNLNDPELKHVVTSILSLSGTNFIELMYIKLFKTSNTIMNDIKNFVGDALCCHKVTVQANGSAKCIYQSAKVPAIKLKSRSGGRHIDLHFDETGHVQNVTSGSKEGNHQWFGYTF